MLYAWNMQTASDKLNKWKLSGHCDKAEEEKMGKSYKSDPTDVLANASADSRSTRWQLFNFITYDRFVKIRVGSVSKLIFQLKEITISVACQNTRR